MQCLSCAGFGDVYDSLTGDNLLTCPDCYGSGIWQHRDLYSKEKAGNGIEIAVQAILKRLAAQGVQGQ